MNSPIIAVVIVFISTLAAFAGQERALSEFRSHLDAGDYESLETAASEILASGSQEDIAIYRAISANLYRTTHPVRLETIRAWLAAYPASSHALTANAWSEIHLAYASGLSAGNSFGKGTFPNGHPNTEEIVRARRRAIEHAKSATERGSQNVSAIDAWMHTLSWSEPGSFFGLHARRLLKLAPNRESMLSVLSAKTGPRVVHKERELVDACLRFADQAENYDRHMCMVDVAYQNAIASDWALEAAKALKALSSDNRFDYARLEEILYPTRPREPDGSLSVRPDITMKDAKRLKELYLSSINQLPDVLELVVYSRRIGSYLENSEFQHELDGYLVAEIENRLLDDPYNPNYLEALMRLNFGQGKYDHVNAAFVDVLRYGWHRPETWMFAAVSELQRDDTNFNYAVELLETATAAQGNNVYALSPSLYHLREALDNSSSNAPGYERAQCTALRLARLMEGLCQISEDPVQFCDQDDHPAKVAVTRTLAEVDLGACPNLQGKRLSELRFMEVDLDRAAREIRE